MCKYIVASFCCVALIPIVLASGDAKPYTVTKPLKALIDEIFVDDGQKEGNERTGKRWPQWPPKRAALEAFGILQVIRNNFADIFAGKSLITELTPREIAYSKPTVAVVIADGGNSVDGILTALFLWFHGIQVVGFQIRNSTKSDLDDQRALDSAKLASEIVKIISSEANVTCAANANLLLLDVMNKHVFEVLEGEDIDAKIKRYEEYYSKLGDALYVVFFDIALFKADGKPKNNSEVIERMGGAINDLFDEKLLSKKSEFYAEDVVASLKGVMRDLKIEIIEEGKNQWEESKTNLSKLDVFSEYENIVLALDALNGPSTQHFCIYQRFYLGLAILKGLKEGRNGTFKILGVDMPSFYENLALEEQVIEPMSDELKQRLRNDVSRVVSSDILIPISYFRKSAVPISGVECHLVVPEPVQAVLDKHADNKDPDTKPLVQPIKNWLTFDESTKSKPKPSMVEIFKDPNALLSYCRCLRVKETLPTVLPSRLNTLWRMTKRLFRL